MIQHAIRAVQGDEAKRPGPKAGPLSRAGRGIAAGLALGACALGLEGRAIAAEPLTEQAYRMLAELARSAERQKAELKETGSAGGGSSPEEGGKRAEEAAAKGVEAAIVGIKDALAARKMLSAMRDPDVEVEMAAGPAGPGKPGGEVDNLTWEAELGSVLGGSAVIATIHPLGRLTTLSQRKPLAAAEDFHRKLGVSSEDMFEFTACHEFAHTQQLDVGVGLFRHPSFEWDDNKEVAEALARLARRSKSPQALALPHKGGDNYARMSAEAYADVGGAIYYLKLKGFSKKALRVVAAVAKMRRDNGRIQAGKARERFGAGPGLPVDAYGAWGGLAFVVSNPDLARAVPDARVNRAAILIASRFVADQIAANAKAGFRDPLTRSLNAPVAALVMAGLPGPKDVDADLAAALAELSEAPAAKGGRKAEARAARKR